MDSAQLFLTKNNPQSDSWNLMTNWFRIYKNLNLMPPLTTIPKFNLVKAQQYIFNPAWGGNNGSVDSPCCTVVARQDKAPLYLVSTELGQITIPVYESDSGTMIKIKEFMVTHGVVDIKMRMLNIPELKQIQGFPKDYKLIGNQTEQKKFIGNAVEVNQAKALIETHYQTLARFHKQLSA